MFEKMTSWDKKIKVQPVDKNSMAFPSIHYLLAEDDKLYLCLVEKKFKTDSVWVSDTFDLPEDYVGEGVLRYEELYNLVKD